MSDADMAITAGRKDASRTGADAGLSPTVCARQALGGIVEADMGQDMARIATS